MVLPLLSERLGHRELLTLRGTSRELRALASEDLAWTGLLRSLFGSDDEDIGEDERLVAVFPLRARGSRRDSLSFFPIEVERVELAGLVLPPAFAYHPPPLRVNEGVLEDMLHPESEAVEPFDKALSRTKVYKARPLPLRCDKCDVACDSYASFTAHCALSAHKILLDPERRFDPRLKDALFIDPRHARDAFATLPTMRKFAAMHTYRSAMVAFLSQGPELDEEWKNMQSIASDARDTVENGAPLFGLSKKERKGALRKCTAKRVAEVCGLSKLVREATGVPRSQERLTALGPP